jgi:uncharacterized membrane protein
MPRPNATITSYFIRLTRSYCFWQKFKKYGNNLACGKIFIPKFLKSATNGVINVYLLYALHCVCLTKRL